MNEIANEVYRPMDMENESVEGLKESEEAMNALKKEMTENILNAEQYVYITKSGKTYHKTPDCPILKHKEFTKIKLSEVGDRTPCKRCNKH